MNKLQPRKSLNNKGKACFNTKDMEDAGDYKNYEVGIIMKLLQSGRCKVGMQL